MGPDRSDQRAVTGTSTKRAARAGPLAIAILAAAVVGSPASGAQIPGEVETSRWHTRPFSTASGRGAVPPDEVLVRNGATFGEIYVRTDDIFDPEQPGEDGFLFQLANRLHVTTRPAVIERKLLFRPGDPYDPRLLEETARYLRSQGYLYDAKVEPLAYRGNRVDVLVTTRDVWTLSGGAGFERSGGENSFQVNLRESNFLGSGRFVDLKYTDDPDRSSSRFRFVDTALLDRHLELRLWYARNSDGHRRIFDLERPFYALDSRWSAATKWISDQRLEKIYHQGEVSESFYHERTFAEVRSGLSKGYRDGKARRWLWGYTFERDRFWNEALGSDRPETFPGGPPPFPFDPPLPGDKSSAQPPRERRLSYLWLGVEEVEDRYIQTHNMDQLQRTEDFNLGIEYRARLGFSSEALGGDRDQAVFSADVRSGFAPRSGQLVFLSGYASGRLRADGHENVRIGGEIRYFLRDFGRHRLLATVRADAAWNPDPEDQLLLGGESGLRGYPFRFQDGDRRLLISLEQRFYTDWELFRLIHVGAAVFLDLGRAWYGNGRRAGDEAESDLLKDVGLGLRLSSSRSAEGQMVHLDVAFPLDGDTEKVQWLVTSKKSF